MSIASIIRLDFINKPENGFDEEGKKWAKESFDKLAMQSGKFVNLDSAVVSIEKFDAIYVNVQNFSNTKLLKN